MSWCSLWLLPGGSACTLLLALKPTSHRCQEGSVSSEGPRGSHQSGGTTARPGPGNRILMQMPCSGHAPGRESGVCQPIVSVPLSRCFLCPQSSHAAKYLFSLAHGPRPHGARLTGRQGNKSHHNRSKGTDWERFSEVIAVTAGGERSVGGAGERAVLRGWWRVSRSFRVGRNCKGRA